MISWEKGDDRGSAAARGRRGEDRRSALGAARVPLSGRRALDAALHVAARRHRLARAAGDAGGAEAALGLSPAALAAHPGRLAGESETGAARVSDRRAARAAAAAEAGGATARRPADAAPAAGALVDGFCAGHARHGPRLSRPDDRG